MSTQRLTIYLLAEGATFEDALDSDTLKGFIERPLADTDNIAWRLFTKHSPPRPPSWANFLMPIATDGLDDLMRASASASALLLMNVNDRVYALPFGWGRSLINQALIERRFGLKVALDLIDDKQIRSMDTKLFDQVVVSRNTQPSRASDLTTFGVDVHRDILRAVTGATKQGSKYKSISGADALVLGFDEPIDSMPALLRDLQRSYQSKSYRASFPWIDQLAEVKDPALTSSLDSLLVTQLQNRNTSTTHLAMPENLRWEDIDYFSIAPTARKKQFPELDLDDYLDEISSELPSLSSSLLKKRKVSVTYLRGGPADNRWSLHQCLVSEQRFNEALYALIEGHWFEVNDSLVKSVDAEIQALPSSALALPPAFVGEHEGAYNERVADAQSNLALLDKKLVAPIGANSKLEFCDLMATDGSLIHVKRKTQSATLSHLFAQGRASAESIADADARRQIRKAITEQIGVADPSPWLLHIPETAERLNRANLTITYAVIANTKAAGVDWLPFFSRLSLSQTVRDLRRMGYTRIALDRIPIVPEPSATTSFPSS